jgi:hypothetical protein
MQFHSFIVTGLFAVLAFGAEDKVQVKDSAKKEPPKQAAQSGKTSKPDKSNKAASKRPKPAPATTAQAPAQPMLPSGAVEVEAGVWRHTDKDGRVWHYRQTPFGLSKSEPNPSPLPVAPREESSNITARDLGDKVEFETQSPFGTRKWTRKKSELTQAEQAALSRAAQTKSSDAASKQ